MSSTITNKDIALSIIDFLKQSVAKKEVAEDYAESMDVAIDCIADAFEVNKEDDSKTLKDVFHGKSLSELLKSSFHSALHLRNRNLFQRQRKLTLTPRLKLMN